MLSTAHAAPKKEQAKVTQFAKRAKKKIKQALDFLVVEVIVRKTYMCVYVWTVDVYHCVC